MHSLPNNTLHIKNPRVISNYYPITLPPYSYSTCILFINEQNHKYSWAESLLYVWCTTKSSPNLISIFIKSNERYFNRILLCCFKKCLSIEPCCDNGIYLCLYKRGLFFYWHASKGGVFLSIKHTGVNTVGIFWCDTRYTGKTRVANAMKGK